MKKHLLVIKLGGVLLESEQAIKRLFNVLRNYLKLYDRPIMIVHGGGRLIDQLMEKLQFPIVKKNGFRITPREHINVITGVLAGTANKILCSWAKKIGISAVGLCLSDGDSLKIKQLDKKLGHVGIAKSGSDKFLKVLFK
ncbi:acetylglutamate kinase, partial [Buchnera aphidicola (Hormaphis cornu)]